MRSRYFVALACALCTAGAVSCSDDGSEQMDTLPLQGGNAGASNGGSSNGGSANGGSANGGTSGSNQGGTGNPGSGGTGQAGTAGGGMAGSMMGEAGTGGDVPDAGGGEDEPDSGGPDPNEDTVGFSEVFPILVANCGGCHGNPNGLPGFAQANDEDASYEETQQNGNQGQTIAQRIIARAVTARTMPPGCGGGQLGQGACLDADEAADLQAWLADGALP